MESRKPMSRKKRGSVSGQTVVLILLAAGVGIVAWLGGRRAERAALIEKALRERTEAPVAPAKGEVARRPAAPAAAVAAEELSATVEVAVVPPPPTPTAAFLSAPAIRADDPGRCLTLEASPSFVSAYGGTGPALQLVVLARNSCATGFRGESTDFRAVAVSMDGTELGAASGRFSGEIKPYSTAETLVAVEADPTRIRSWRVELR